METIDNNNNGSAQNISIKNKEPSSRPEFFLQIIRSSTSIESQSPGSEEDFNECTEIEIARLKFKEISESIENEEKQLRKLEERRQKLEEDMERLQQDIEIEKELFRQKIDSDLARKADRLEISSGDSSPTSSYQSKIDPLSINTEEVSDRLREYREAVEDSQLQTQLHDDNTDINRLKQNLATYKKALHETRKEKFVKQKRKAAAKIFQKHLEEVDSKCNEQIKKLTTIQRSIGNINISGAGDRIEHLEL